MQRIPGRPTFYFIAIGLSLLLAMIGCGGGGGGDVTSDKVTILGTAEDGTGNAISNAKCGFKDMDGHYLVSSNAAANGKFTIQLDPGKEGFLECSPPDMPKLILSTFVSTKDRQGGDTISETLTPNTTVVANIIISEDAEIPLARKTELNHLIETSQDGDLNLVTGISTALYQAMLRQQVDVDFAGGGEGGGDGGGGVGGDGGDGAAASPIADARCEFIVNNDLMQGSVLYSAAIADFLDDGELSRPDLQQVIQDLQPLLQTYSPEEIQSAFEAFFKDGVGEAYVTYTDADGKYFIKNPPNVPGFVRCFPPDQEKLVLATYVPARSERENLDNQRVNPATTYFSHKIASKLTENVDTTKDNYIDNISELGDIQIEKGVDGTITGFHLDGDVNFVDNDIADEDVTMVAFSAATLFNVLYKNGADVDYLKALDDLVEKKSFSAADFIALGIPATEAPKYETVFKDSLDGAEGTLKTSLDAALTKAKINVAVTDTPGGTGISDAMVEITVPLGVTWNPSSTVTDADGKVTFTLSGLSSEVASIAVEASGVAGYLPTEKTVDVVASANVDLEIVMVPQASCTYTISPTSKSFSSAGGTGTISVDALSSDCSWTATESVSWITIESGASGTGDGTVTYIVLANNNSQSRSATITVAGESHQVTQEEVKIGGKWDMYLRCQGVTENFATGTIDLEQTGETFSGSGTGNNYNEDQPLTVDLQGTYDQSANTISATITITGVNTYWQRVDSFDAELENDTGYITTALVSHTGSGCVIEIRLVKSSISADAAISEDHFNVNQIKSIKSGDLTSGGLTMARPWESCAPAND